MATVSVHESLYPVDKLVPMVACCCAIVSCYFGEVGCCQISKSGGGGGHGPSVDVKCCSCIECPCYTCTCPCKMDCVKVSFASFMECFCLDIRCAFPQVSEVPLLCTFFFVTLCYDGQRTCKFCASLGHFLGEDALTKVEMTRK